MKIVNIHVIEHIKEITGIKKTTECGRSGFKLWSGHTNDYHIDMFCFSQHNGQKTEGQTTQWPKEEQQHNGQKKKHKKTNNDLEWIHYTHSESIRL
jgi:hypothetical protein